MEDQARVEGAFRTVLNSHGHAFQFALAADLQRRFREGTPWKVDAIEVPVEVNGSTTRIDFVLVNTSRPVWIACECKRVDPALSNWCFTTAPSVLGGNSTDVLVERFRFLGAGRHSTQSEGDTAGSCPAHYDTANEVRSQEQGDGRGSGRSAIEDAMTQVIRGVNGLVNLADRERALVLGQGPQIVTAAIFTTARLWASTVPLDQTDLATGKADFTNATFERKSWLPFRYRLTPNLRHSFPSGSGVQNFTDVVERDFLRTVFVVAPEGVDEFLEWAATGIG